MNKKESDKKMIAWKMSEHRAEYWIHTNHWSCHA